MNSREFGHERFEELCALSALGQISAEEFRDLQVHLQTCTICRLRQADFTEILHEHLPLLAPTDAAMPGSRNVAFHDASYKQRFIQRAQKEGLVFSPEVTGATKPRQPEATRWLDLAWLWQPKRLAFSVALVGLGFWLGSLGARRVIKMNVPPSPDVARVQDENSRLKQQIALLATQQPMPQAEKPVPQPQLLASTAYTELERQLAQARRDYSSSVTRAQALDEQLQKASAEVASLREEASKLRSESPASATLKDTEAAFANSELQKLQLERSVYASTFTDQQAQIRELMEKLGKQTESIEQERELTAASRDIRQLMGARNLHIIDVEDVEEARGPKQPVGRVFYTEGKSLIFYAFDLEKRRKSLEKYSFQAWGQREAKGGPVQSLGVFVNDDQGKSPWVLKYDDPKVLAQIDSVFVTIEPKGGSNRPQGRQLMYAYLRANPNHP